MSRMAGASADGTNATPVGFTVFLNLRPKPMMEEGMGDADAHGTLEGRIVR